MKIGVTSDLDARLSALQTGSAHQLSLAYATRVAGDAYAVEAEAHAMLDRHRLSGEWFAVPADVAVAAVNGAAFRLGYSGQREGQESGPWFSKRRFMSAVAVGVPFWLLTWSALSMTAPIYLLVPFVWLVVKASSSPGPAETLAKWVAVSILGIVAALLPAMVISRAYAEERPPIPNYDTSDYCTKISAVFGDNPIFKDGCVSNEESSKKDLSRVWSDTPPKLEKDCIALMEAAGQRHYTAISGCLIGSIGNLWMRGELKLAPNPKP